MGETRLAQQHYNYLEQMTMKGWPLPAGGIQRCRVDGLCKKLIARYLLLEQNSIPKTSAQIRSWERYIANTELVCTTQNSLSISSNSVHGSASH